MRKEYSKWMPVSDGNLSGIEGWLDSLAKEGFFLKEADGRSWYFWKEEPKPVRYRLDAVTEKEGRLDPEKQADYESMGWRYVCTHKKLYHIFRADDPETEELHTDGLVESIALERMEQKFRRDRMWAIGTTAAWGICIFFWHGLISYPIVPLVTLDFTLLYWIVWMCFSIGVLRQDVKSCRELREIKESLEAGERPAVMEESKNRGRREKGKFVMKVVCMMAVLALMFSSIKTKGSVSEELETRKLPSLEVLSLGEVLPYDREKPKLQDERYLEERNFLMRDNYRIMEERWIKRPDGTTYMARLHAWYYELKFSLLTVPFYDGLVEKYCGGAETKRITPAREIEGSSEIREQGAQMDDCVLSEKYGQQMLAARAGNKILVLRYEGEGSLAEQLDQIEELLTQKTEGGL